MNRRPLTTEAEAQRSGDLQPLSAQAAHDPLQDTFGNAEIVRSIQGCGAEPDTRCSQCDGRCEDGHSDPDITPDESARHESSSQLASFIPSVPPIWLAGSVFSGPSCTPYTSRVVAEAAWAWVKSSWSVYSAGLGTYGPWASYLDRSSAAIPRPAQTLTDAGTVRGFTSHRITILAEQGLLDAVIRAVQTGLLPVPRDTRRRVTLASALGPGTVWSMLNGGGSHEMNFDGVATTIAGNLAGGVGAGGKPGHSKAWDADTRNAWGEVDVAVSAAGAITVMPLLTFHVHDTVDLCPGALGGFLARLETTPMSRLEATERRLGPVFAADVPIDISYPGPGNPRTAAPYIAPPAPHVFPPGPPGPAPPAPVPVPPVPVPPPPVVPAPVVLPGPVLFDFNSDRLTTTGQAEVARQLPHIRGAARTEIIGHTDSVGSATYNQGLSERRAQAVQREIVRLDASLAPRLVPSGRGLTSPVASNATAAGRAQNRRVELVFRP